MSLEHPAESVPAPVDRATLLRDVALLQVKLVVDGLRDFLLVPVSLIVGIVGLAERGDNPGREFYRLLRFGRRSEKWINLFGAADRHPDEAEDAQHFPAADIDTLVGRVEEFVRDEHRRGAVSEQARDRLRRALDSLSRGR